MRRLLLCAALVFAIAASPAEARVALWPPLEWPPTLQSADVVKWRHSRAIGVPSKGRLKRGVKLPDQGQDFFTWDFPRNRSPSRGWRRWGTDRLVYTLLTVLHQYRLDTPGVPRVGIADLSRPKGGRFGKRYGGLGHASHQNGLDVDILYPRRDRTELPPWRVREVDRKLSQDLVSRFAAANAQYVFIGPRTRLRGPRRTVIKLIHHDDHMHVRIR